MAMPITTKRAAEILGCNSSRVRQFILSGQLHAEKHGRDWLISKNAVLRFARSERKPGRPAKTIYFAYFDTTLQNCRVYHTGQILPKSQYWHLQDSGSDYKELITKIKKINPDVIIQVM